MAVHPQTYPLLWWTDQTITGRFIGRHSEERIPIGFLSWPEPSQINDQGCFNIFHCLPLCGNRYRNILLGDCMDTQTVNPLLATKIVGSYLRHHTVAASELPNLITSVHRALTEVERTAAPVAQPRGSAGVS